MTRADRSRRRPVPYSQTVRSAVGIAALIAASGAYADDALRAAAEALARDDYAAAIPHLEAALEDDPDNVNARFNLAFARQSTGGEDEAIRHYRFISQKQPDLVAARQNLAILLAGEGEFGEAAVEFAAVAAARPGDPAIPLLEADAWLRAGDAPAAAAAYRRALAADEASLDALVGLAGALAEAGRLVEAVPYYLRAAEADAAVGEALPDLARRLEQAGSAHDALELYRRYARNRPGDASVQEDVGIRLLESGNARAAAAALELAVAAEPSANRHAALAEALRQLGKRDAAREQLRLAAQAAPGDAGARVRYATALLREQDYDRAAQHFLAACEADPASQDAWNGLGLASFQLGNFAGALRALRESERLGPPPAASVYLKALAADRLQQYEDAQAAYRAFLALNPDMPDEAWKAEQRLVVIGKVLAKR